jgi:hypothetical protein
MSGTARGIYLPDGTFQPFSMESFTTEIATRQNAGATLADMGQWLDQLPDPDPILRKRGDDARILAELYTDDQVTTATLARKNRVLNAPQYGFRPGGPDGEPVTPEARNVYDRLAQDLERVSLRPLISSILDAPFSEAFVPTTSCSMPSIRMIGFTREPLMRMNMASSGIGSSVGSSLVLIRKSV